MGHLKIDASPEAAVLKARFNFYGVRLFLRSDEPWVFEELRRDFEAFLEKEASGPRPPSVSIGIWKHNLKNGHALPLGNALSLPWWAWRWRGARFWQKGPVRYVNYQREALGIYDFEKEEGSLESENPLRLRELGYLMIHSRVGELLDLKGLHRIHALGFSYRDRRILVLLPSGGGKSTLAKYLLKNPEVRLFSDDIPLVDSKGRISSFPQRLGFSPQESQGLPPDYLRLFERSRHGPKILVDFDFYRDRVENPGVVTDLILGRRTPENGEGAVGQNLTPCGNLKLVWPLFLHLVLGWGIPQVLEYFWLLDLRGCLGKAGIVVRRFRAGLNLLRRANVHRLHLSSDPAADARRILDCLN